MNNSAATLYPYYIYYLHYVIKTIFDSFVIILAIKSTNSVDLHKLV